MCGTKSTDKKGTASKLLIGALGCTSAPKLLFVMAELKTIGQISLGYFISTCRPFFFYTKLELTSYRYRKMKPAFI